MSTSSEVRHRPGSSLNAAAASTTANGPNADGPYEFGKDPKERKLVPLVIVVLGLGALLCVASHQLDFVKQDKINGLLAMTAVTVVVLFATTDPLPQALAYHDFADQRRLCCIPNTFDVCTNIPFALVSAFGIDHVVGGAVTSHCGVPAPVFADASTEKPLWLLYFTAVGLVSLGSAYYHWKPSNARLVWDRLPMTMAFMAILSNAIGDTMQLATPTIVAGLMTVGAASVFYWSVTDDLRPYVLVQFYSLALLPLLMILFPSPYGGALPDYGLALVFYAGAKVCENRDQQIWAATGRRISGHSIKHLLAAVGAGWASVLLMRRTVRG